LSTSSVEKCFIFWGEKQSAISDTHRNNTRIRVTHRFGCLRVTPITCGIKAPKRHSNKHGFSSIFFLRIRPSIEINKNDFLKTRLVFNFYAHIACKNDWNNFFLLNTNGPLRTLKPNGLYKNQTE